MKFKYFSLDTKEVKLGMWIDSTLRGKIVRKWYKSFYGGKTIPTICFGQFQNKLTGCVRFDHMHRAVERFAQRGMPCKYDWNRSISSHNNNLQVWRKGGVNKVEWLPAMRYVVYTWDRSHLPIQFVDVAKSFWSVPVLRWMRYAFGLDFPCLVVCDFFSLNCPGSAAPLCSNTTRERILSAISCTRPRFQWW